MTANQIAYARAREEQRANKEQERIKNYESGLKKVEAEASRSQAQTAFYNALTKEREVTLQEMRQDSEVFKNITGGIQSIGKAIGSAIGALGAIFG